VGGFGFRRQTITPSALRRIRQPGRRGRSAAARTYAAASARNVSRGSGVVCAASSRTAFESKYEYGIVVLHP
jgi:hypothetical protein